MSGSERDAEQSECAATRASRADAVVAALRHQWARGEATDDDVTFAAHPELLPELATAVRKARLVRDAIGTARKLGPAAENRVPARLLTDAELAEPLELLDDRRDERSRTTTELVVEQERRWPRVPGCLLLGQIATGGQAEVYRGVVDSTRREVAVKIVPRGSTSDVRHRRRFEREVEILATVRHPHIVDIIDRGRTEDGDFYLVMPFVDGCDLERWWSRQLPPGEAGTRVLLQQFVRIGQAVQAAHARGIVHRDLKPGNIRIDEHGEPRILDFGLARPVDRQAESRTVTAVGQLLGSVPWASPEQAAGGSATVDARTDVYAMGVMLYQALTGCFPYPVDGPLHETLRQIAQGEVPPPSARANRPLVRADELNAILFTALAKRPPDRYVSAGAFAEDLQRLLQGQPVLAPTLRRGARVRRSKWRIFAVVAGLAITALGLIPAARSVRSVTGAPTVFPLPTLTNSVGMRLVAVPPGQFWMGSPRSEEGRDPNELRRHVTLSGFYIGVTEVTQRQYARVMGSTLPSSDDGGGDLPVHGVSWRAAVTFCQRLSAAEGKSYRLPYETEWEYACRAGEMTPLPPGTALDDVAWYAGTSDAKLHPVGLKWPNAWGIYDVHGNVQEWCNDVVTLPGGPNESRAGAVSWRALRGGSIQSAAHRCRAAARTLVSSEHRTRDSGFRVVLDMPQ